MRTSTTSPLLAALTGALLGLPCSAIAGDTFYGDPGGLLDLDDLINLALQSSPDVVRLQGRIATTRFEEKAASDWRDPELRVSYSRDNDVELPPSETETRRTKSSETTRENRDETERDNINGSTTNSTRDSTTTTRTEQIERIRTDPGATSDRITTETSEVTTETTRFSDRSIETGSNGGRSFGSEDVIQNTSERVTGRSEEIRSFGNGFDRTDPDSDLDFSLRLRPPNPWEVGAKKDKARTRREMFRSLVHAAEFKVIFDIREAYAKAQEAAAELSSARNLTNARKKILAEMEADQVATTDDTGNIGNSLDDLLKFERKIAENQNKRFDDIANAEGDLISAESKVSDLELELADALAKLALESGLSDPSRISLASNLMPPGIDVGALDREFLYSVAESWREDLLELTFQAKLAGIELREYNAQKIPWFTLLEGFYEVNNSSGSRTSDGYGVQVGISIPIFSWFFNDEDDVHRSEMEGLELEAAALRRQVRAQIDASLLHLDNTRARIGSYETRIAKNRARLQTLITESKNYGSQGNGIRYRAEEKLVELDEDRADIREHEIGALLRLEKALGAEFRKVLGRAASAKEAPRALPVP